MKLPFKLSLGFVTISLPFFLLMTVVRLLISPALPEIEYRTPWFPEDSYGFTFQERLDNAHLAINYLTSNEDITYLARLKFADQTPLYNQRELSHFVDVKTVIQRMVIVWDILLVILLVLVVLSWRTGQFNQLGDAIWRGGVATLALIFLMLAGVLLGFDQLFTGFHRLFFSGDSWIFRYSDTLIRLFPIRFWQDVFIAAGLLTIAGAMLCLVAGRKLYRSAP